MPARKKKANDKKQAGITIMIALVATLIIGVWLISTTNNDDSSSSRSSSGQSRGALPSNIHGGLTASFTTDFANSSLDDFGDIVSGGPSKDGIPALNDPEFEPISQTNIAETTRGVLLELNGEKRFYPYNVLVWHEIANDQIGDTPFAVTFCPLCGTAIVFDRRVDGQTLDFGVSGFLRESNMIMFDRQTETLWQQSTGKAFAGEFNDIQLERLPFQLLELFDVRDKHPDAVVMTTDTGHSRNYSVYPYGNYDNSDDLYFEVSVDDNRFQSKELFYIVEQNGTSVAMRVGNLSDGQQVDFNRDSITISAEKTDGEVFVRDSNGDVLPGYYEMWFSWATWHQDDGVVWEP